MNQTTLFGADCPPNDIQATPQNVFDCWNERFHFTIDVCALPENTKLPRFYSPDDDGLKQSWAGERVWCNPPFTQMPAWVQKAHSEFCNGCDLIVMLAPISNMDQDWWHRFIEPYRDKPSHKLSMEVLQRKIKFTTTRTMFGCCLLIWDNDI